AVMEKSATFAGAASDRMNSLEGSVARQAAAWDKLKTSFSSAFASSPIVTNLIKTLTDAFGDLSIEIDEVQKKISEGKTPEQIAKEVYPGPTVGDYVQAIPAFSGLLGYLGVFGQTIKNAGDPNEVYKRNRAA